jgi:heterodisulfide reductase subunit A-like polyferredoxin
MASLKWLSTALVISNAVSGAIASPSYSARYVRRDDSASQCRKTKVAVLGAGVAGITAAVGCQNLKFLTFLASS